MFSRTLSRDFLAKKHCQKKSLLKELTRSVIRRPSSVGEIHVLILVAAAVTLFKNLAAINTGNILNNSWWFVNHECPVIVRYFSLMQVTNAVQSFGTFGRPTLCNALGLHVPYGPAI